MSPHAVPAFRLVVPLCVGMALMNYLRYPLWGGIGWVIAAAGIGWWWGNRAFHYDYRSCFGLYAFLLLALTGYVRMGLHDERQSPAHIVHRTAPLRYIVGMADEAPVRGAARWRVPVKVVAAGHHPDSLQPAAGRVLLYWAAKDSSRIPHYGDLLGVRARVEPTRPPANPHAFDYQRYLFHQNIHHQAFVAADSLVFLSSGHGTWWWNAAYTARDQVLALLRQHFPTPDAYAVAAALLVGYKDELSDELREAYTDTGSIHALVVSGSHVSALMVFLALLLNKLPIYGRKSQWVKFLIGIPLIWSFALLTGASASVIRAVVMFSIYLLGNALWRDTNGWNILAGSALILLFFQPAWMFDPGFQLSYSAVAGMLFFYPRFNRLIPVLPKWANYLMDPLLLGCAAQLGTLPLSLYYFHQFPVYFWLSGWVVMFGGTAFLAAGAVLLVFQKWAFVANCIGWGMFKTTLLINGAIFWIQGLPFSVVEDIAVSPGVLVLLICMVLALAALLETRQGIWVIVLSTLCCILGAERIGRKAHQQQHPSLVVYHAGKSRLIDIFDSQQRITLSDSIEEKRLGFIAANQRVHSGTQALYTLTFHDTTLRQSTRVWVELPFIGMGGKKIMLLNGKQPPPLNAHFPQNLDVVIFSNNPSLPHEWCLRQFPHAVWVFDATNSAYWLSKRTALCQQNHARFHDISRQGAFVLEE